MALERNTQFRVINRSSSRVGYTLPDENITRAFQPGETKIIPYWELDKLTYQPGGPYLMANYLLIENEEALQKLGMETEPEYYMTKDQVIDLIRNGSIDAWVDCLNFAPQGIIDMIKDLSVELPLNDVEKREALKNKTDFDVDAAIRNKLADQATEVSSKSTGPARRTSAPNYKIVEKK